METGTQVRFSSDRLEEPGIKLGTPRYKATGLSTTLQQLHSEKSEDIQYEYIACHRKANKFVNKKG